MFPGFKSLPVYQSDPSFFNRKEGFLFAKEEVTMVEFFQTRMGQAFYEGAVPSLVRELKRLNDNLEKLCDLKLRELQSKDAPDEISRQP